MRIILKVRENRLEKDWSLRDLSHQTGISKSELSKIENGLAEPSITNYIKLCLAFGIIVPENKLLTIE